IDNRKDMTTMNTKEGNSGNMNTNLTTTMITDTLEENAYATESFDQNFNKLSY
ncbi:898_t:CDS:1, partial [Ambispora gerdemannii]